MLDERQTQCYNYMIFLLLYCTCILYLVEHMTFVVIGWLYITLMGDYSIVFGQNRIAVSTLA